MDTEVLVVGAGPTGLMLAAELRRRGTECRLIDASPEPRHWDRATVVHPRSLELFDSLGLAGEVLAAGVPQRGARIHSGGELLGEIDFGLSGSRFRHNVGLSEEVTESVLAACLGRLGGEVERSARLVAVEQGADRVRATVEREGEPEAIEAAWIVGCDGFHSAARELAGIGMQGHDIEEPWAVFDAGLDGHRGGSETTLVYLDEPMVVLTPLPGRRYRVYTRPSTPEVDLVAEAAAVLARYEPGATLTGVENPTRFHCHSKVAERYRDGRLLLAGDAAHACTPAQGHGMNSGLGDAANLAWKLSLVCAGADRSLLDSYEAERRPIAAAVIASGDELEAAARIAEPGARAARDRELRANLADAEAVHQEAVAEAEVGYSYAGSPIVSGAGELLPDAEVLRLPEAEPVGLQQLARGPGQTLLLLGEASEAEGLGRRLAALRDGVADSGLFDAAFALGGAPAALAGRGPTLLAVRPDGYVGLRSDGADPAELRRYAERVLTGHPAGPAARAPATVPSCGRRLR